MRAGEVLIGDTPSLTSDYLQSGYDYADGHAAPSVLGTAAAVSALGLTFRSFLPAVITPVQPETEALDPWLTGMMAMQTLMYGNSLTEIRVSRGGDVTLLPAPSIPIVSGGLLPQNWMYAVKRLDQDQNEIDAIVPALAMIHVRYAGSTLAPWRGIGPLQAAGITSAQLAQIEQAMFHDASTPVAQILAAPDQSTLAQRQGMAGSIRDARGRVSVEATTSGGFGVGSQAAPRKDFEASRIGPEVPATAIALRDGSALAVEAALGVPAGLFSQNGGGNREGLRMFYHFTLLPLARLMEAELRVKLDIPDLRISLEELQAVDVSARSRAVGTLAQAGVPLQESLRLVGWTDVDLTPGPDDDTFQV